MSRLYRPDGSLAPCLACRRLHAHWQRREDGAHVAYWCGWVVRTTVAVTPWTGQPQLAHHLCGAEAPADLVEATERVRTGALAPLLDLDPWADLTAA